MIPLSWNLVLSAMVFSIGFLGILLNRRNLLVVLMALELMLLGTNMNFVAFSHYLGDFNGQVITFFVLTVAAAEAAIGLAILVLYYRDHHSLKVDDLSAMKE